ncbi:RHS repeat protein, partial [Candidatus Poribacteria bacterium]|nr:RHS repeat protein [Candidatus Poribacteria bacterium]
NGNLLTSTDPGGNVTSYVNNEYGQPTEIHKPGGAVQTLLYDAQSGNITGMGDSYGNLTQIGYDGWGNLASFTDAAGNTRTMVSDAAGRVLSMTDSEGNTTTFTFDPNGNRLTSTDAAGKTSSFRYDKKSRLVSATDSAGNTTHTNYDGNGNVVARTDAKGSTTTFKFNKGNRLVKTVDPLGNAVRQGYCADVGCPSCGGGGGLNGVCSATDALGNTTVTRFDAMGRATETISPTGSVTTTQLDSLGRQSKTIDALGNEATYLFDQLGRLWKVIDALGGVTEYGFDERGNRTSVRDANGNVTYFQYDLNNRLVKEINPLGIETSFTYDATGSRATRTDGNGFTTIYRYDQNRRLSEIEYPDGNKTQYAFDEKGNKTFEGYFDDSLNFAATSRTFEYDDLNRLRSMTDSSLGKSIQYEFDVNGNRTAIIDAEGGVTRWEYDRNNRPVKVTDPDGQVTRFEYDAAGRRTKAVYPNGVWTEYLYDASSQLTHMVTRDRKNLTLQGWHYIYDLRGDRTSKTDHAGNVESYLYDGLGRLIQTTYPDGRVVRWSYDAVGNRVTQDDNGSVTTYSYNAANQIQTMTSPTGAQTNFGFDGNGNMTHKFEPSGVTQYTWDFENRLRQVSSPSGVTDFGYDANGIRVFKESGGVRTDYLIDTVSVLAEYEAGARKSAYTLGSRIDEIISQTNDQGKFWYLADALGSVTGLTDSAGRVIKTYRYGAWGEDYGVTGTVVRNPYRWTAREWDSTGLQYNRARYYDGTLGGWLTTDPLDIRPLSLYQYANDSPTTLIDPDGLLALVIYGEIKDLKLSNGKYFSTNDSTRQSFEDALVEAFKTKASMKNRLLGHILPVPVNMGFNAVKARVVARDWGDVDEVFWYGHVFYYPETGRAFALEASSVWGIKPDVFAKFLSGFPGLKKIEMFGCKTSHLVTDISKNLTVLAVEVMGKDADIPAGIHFDSNTNRVTSITLP